MASHGGLMIFDGQNNSGPETPPINFFQGEPSRCENEMGKVRKEKGMVQDRLGQQKLCVTVLLV